MRRITTLIAMLALLAACGHGSERHQVPVVSQDSSVVAQLDTRFFFPEGVGPFPLAILLHGSSGGNPRFADSWKSEVELLNSLGFVVAAPMRRGRGDSSGISTEYEDRHCKAGAWIQGLTEATEDIDAVIHYSLSLPGIKPRAITLWGVSRGGFLAVHYAANGAFRNSIRGVVNFVGGWVAQAEDNCPQDFNLAEFRTLGLSATQPMLWLYGSNDKFYGDKAPKEYSAAFQAAGGQMDFIEFSNIPDNGHWLPQHPELWNSVVTRFLSQIPGTEIKPIAPANIRYQGSTD